MKKLISIITSAVVLSSLTACYDSSDNILSTEEQFNHYSYVSMNEGYIFWENSGFASVLDYKTMETAMLCNVPNCAHTTSSCISLLLKDSSQLPVIYNNSAYYFINTKSFVEKEGKNALDMKLLLMKYDFEEMKTSKVAEIKDYNANTDSGCYLIGSDYYFTTNFGNPSYDESGNVWASGESGGGKFFSINLDSGEITDYGEFFDYEALKKEYPAADSSTGFKIRGKQGSELYLCVNYQKERPPREFMEQGIGTNSPFFGETYTFNLETHEVNKVNDHRLIRTMNGYYTFCDGDNETTLFIQDLNTNETIELANYSGSNDVMIHNDKIWEQSTCFDIKTGQKLVFSDLNFAEVIEVYEENYIIRGEDSDGNIVFEKIPCEEIDKLFE